MKERTDPIVSVIIPVFNVEPWLRECLESAVNQSLREIEIICVNDDSTDGSPEILREYAEQDSRIQVINQENKGLSEARNAGVRAARGKYLYFLDSDDILELTAMECCVENMEHRDLDYLCFNAVAFAGDLENAKRAERLNAGSYRRDLDEDTVFTGQELFAKLKQCNCYIAQVMLSMVRRSFFDDQKLWFYPGILHEDALWTFQVLMYAKRAGCINRQLYRYRIRESSITAEKMSFAHCYGSFICSKEIQRILSDHPQLLQNQEYGEIEIAHILSLQKLAVKKYCTCSDAEKQKYRNLSLEDRVRFENMVVYPASLTDRIDQTQTECSGLRKEISNQRKKTKDLRFKKKQLQSEKKQLQSEKRQLQSEKRQLQSEKRQLQSEKRQLQSETKKLKAENRQLKLRVTSLKHSVSWQVGRMVTWLPRNIRAIFHQT